MAKPAFDTLRALAIASQALGFIAIILLETFLGDAARPWQGATLALMVCVALGIALARRYRRNRRLRERDGRLAAARDEEGE